MSVRATAAILLTAGLLGHPGQLDAQTILGRVVDDARNSPVAGAAVRLLDRDGKERANAVSDSVGRFTLTPPEAGDYYLSAERIGYEATRSPLISLHLGGTAPLDLMLAPAPLGLEGITVETEKPAVEQLEFLGIRAEDLGTRWVTQDEIDKIQVKRDVGSILEWQQISGLRVIRPENLTKDGSGGGDPGYQGICLSLQRARDSVHNAGTCALPVLDGITIDNRRLELIDPETIQAIAVLLPTDSRILYGERGKYGAVLFFSKSRTGR